MSVLWSSPTATLKQWFAEIQAHWNSQSVYALIHSHLCCDINVSNISFHCTLHICVVNEHVKQSCILLQVTCPFCELTFQRNIFYCALHVFAVNQHFIQKLYFTAYYISVLWMNISNKSCHLTAYYTTVLWMNI